MVICEPDLNSRPRVLVVDDDPFMLHVLSDILSAHFVVHTATGGKEALQMLDRLSPDAVLSDLIMPDIDGLMLCDRIRRHPERGHLPVMLLSANDVGEVRASALATVDEFLGKPFHTAELIVRLQKLIARRQGPVPAAPRAAPAAPVTPPPEPAPAPPSAGSRHKEAFRQRVEATIRTSLGDPLFTVDDLARQLAVSPRQLRRKLLEIGPLGPKAFVREVRLEAAREALELGTFGTVAEVAAMVAMTPAYFSRAYRAWMGSPPSSRLG